ncbi:hypothetical protein SUGI_0026500 [Cryptomeria japonica]|uniref:uncharacterized protein LOC131070148 n=1 Tax=Cryptomeria japonica TaxID=3369 RepID=UPI002408B023|nr:uncharacterized protein LOC131070148 [Cryptomeria japonica]GLJ05844.1 hypothetical protein SUGI_0026500 [Cryptomeria japonica]
MSLVTAVKLKCVASAALPLLPTQLSQSQRRSSRRSQSRGGADGQVVCALSSSKSVQVQREEKIEFVEEILSGEWPQSFSILNFEDLSVYYEPLVFKAQSQPSILLAEVMSEHVYTATPEQLLEDIDHHFAKISGLPIINKEMKCIGVLAKTDKRKASNGLKSKVGEVMSSPVITLSADNSVLDAAILMLKNKINRIPIVNEDEHVVGIVTRTDIFNALEGFSV